MIADHPVLAATPVAAIVGAAHSAAPPRDPFRAVIRPLALPRLPAGAACPRTPGRRSAPRVGITLGPGPAYPVLGFSAAPPDRRGDVELDARSARRGWYFHTTLWAFSPRYRGPLLIRGRRLDRPQQVRFHTGSYPRRELRVPPGHAPQGHWSYGVSSTMLRAPGCYGLQIDGLTFSRAVVFRAVLPAARVTAGRRPRGDPR